MREAKDILGPIDQNEMIARYVLTSRFIRKSNSTVKGGAFEESRAGEYISVCRTDTLTEKETWELGRDYVARPAGKKLYGRATLKVAEAEDNKFSSFTEKEKITLLNEIPEITDLNDIYIRVRPTPNSHPYHADIEYEPFVKSIVKHIAKKLARSALFVSPTPEHIAELCLHNTSIV